MGASFWKAIWYWRPVKIPFDEVILFLGLYPEAIILNLDKFLHKDSHCSVIYNAEE